LVAGRAGCAFEKRLVQRYHFSIGLFERIVGDDRLLYRCFDASAV
jgi:hypothetical protein